MSDISCLPTPSKDEYSWQCEQLFNFNFLNVYFALIRTQVGNLLFKLISLASPAKQRSPKYCLFPYLVSLYSGIRNSLLAMSLAQGPLFSQYLSWGLVRNKSA